MWHRVGHRAMPKRSDQPPLSVHRQIARGPHRRQTDVAGENSIRGRLVTDRLGDLLRMDRRATGLADREVIETFAGLAVVRGRLVEMRAVTLLLEERQHAF